MYREIFIKDFSLLGKVISEHITGVNHNSMLATAIERSESDNRLFTQYMQIEAMRAISVKFLDENLLRMWLEDYDLSAHVTAKSHTVGDAKIRCSVGIIMAGNIPLAGFHDLISVLATGGRAIVKPSSKDRYLIRAFVKSLTEINDFWGDRILFVDKLIPTEIDKVIASGRSETMERLKTDFGDIPMLLRGSRFSAAVVRGNEDAETLRKLGADIFLYFGLGCRSVSALLVPEGYDFTGFVRALKEYSSVTDVEDYRAAYRYARAQAIMDGGWFEDGGFYILKKEKSLPPQLAVIAVESYKSNADIEHFLKLNSHKMQCMLNYNFNGCSIEFGGAQLPALGEYADGIDTIEWLL